MKVFLLTFLLSVTLAAGVNELITKDYIILSSGNDAFQQYSLDLKFSRSIKRPENQLSTQAIKIKHVGYEIHIYWFVNQSKGKFFITKVSRSSEKTETLNLGQIITDSMYDMDVHPNEDVIYAASRNGLFKINTSTEHVEKMDEGNFKLIKLDSKREVLYSLSCSAIPEFKKMDFKNNSIETYPMDFCYDAWDFDFENDEVYLARNKQLFKTSITNIMEFNSNETLKKSEIKLDIKYPISCIALGSEYLYLKLDGDTTFTTISRKDRKVTSINLHTYSFAFGLKEGEELEEEPKPTTFEPTTEAEPTTVAELTTVAEPTTITEPTTVAEPPNVIDKGSGNIRPPIGPGQPINPEPPKDHEPPIDPEHPIDPEQPIDPTQKVPSKSPRFEATIISFFCFVIVFFFI